MTPAHFVFRFTCLLLVNMAQTNHHVSSAVQHKSGLISVKVGDTLTLECNYDPNIVTKSSWYKVTLGQNLQLISTFHKFETSGMFYDEFKNNTRFRLDSEKGINKNKNNLIITDLQASDTATYYCSSSHLHVCEFGDGTTVLVESSGSPVQTWDHQLEYETIEPGGYATLTCTVQTGSCDGEHNVYWFRNSQESLPGLLYRHKGRNDQCGEKNQQQTNTCLYSLPLRNLNLSHTGTYYCAVALCGHIIFGNGTKLGFKDGENSVYLLTGSLAFTCFLSGLQAFLLFRIYMRNKSNNSEAHSGFFSSFKTTEETDQDEDNLQYAGLRLQKVYTSTRQGMRDTEMDCVYSHIKK